MMNLDELKPLVVGLAGLTGCATTMPKIGVDGDARGQDEHDAGQVLCHNIQEDPVVPERTVGSGSLVKELTADVGEGVFATVTCTYDRSPRRGDKHLRSVSVALVGGKPPKTGYRRYVDDKACIPLPAGGKCEEVRRPDGAVDSVEDSALLQAQRSYADPPTGVPGGMDMFSAADAKFTSTLTAALEASRDAGKRKAMANAATAAQRR